MARKKRTPEENARREKIRELLRTPLGEITSTGGIEQRFR